MLKEKIKKLEGELIQLRREFHENPELGYREFNTAIKIEEYLNNIGIKTSRVCETGVVGIINIDDDLPTIALRADIDALSVLEETNVEYSSKNKGIMHACGHDGHIAMLLIAAKFLYENKDMLKGNIKLIFQPNEEVAGAKDMIEAGVLENPKVEACFGLHLWTPLNSGKIGISKGAVMSALEEFEITVYGSGGHTGSPHTAIDTIIAASKIVNDLQIIQTREIDPLKPISIIVGKIQGGTGRNIIAEECYIGGTVRFLFNNEEIEKEKLLTRIENMVKCIGEELRVECKVKYIPSNPALINNDSLYNLAYKSALETYDNVSSIVEEKVMAGEDFAEFSKVVPSFFSFIGTGSSEKNTCYPHHHPKFNIDEDTLLYGVEMHIRTVINYFSK